MKSSRTSARGVQCRVVCDLTVDDARTLAHTQGIVHKIVVVVTENILDLP